MKKLSLILVALFFTCAIAIAQKTVTGNVTDQSGLPLIGASVVAEGTTVGTITDIDGNFNLKVPENVNNIVISYTGFANQVVNIQDLTNVVITLAEGELIDEVVVTALGLSRDEKAVGYSVQTLDNESFNKTQESNLVNSLTGRIAGVQINNSSGAVGASSRITLRGVTSLTGNNDPLFVVDGIPIDNASYGTAGNGGGFDLPNGVADLNPNDIESITVLKGPNAAALYGVRAANGVIVITTKSGTSRKGVGISFNSSVTWENPLVLPDFQNSYGQGGDDTYFEYIDGQHGDGGTDESWGPALDVGYNFVQFESKINGNNEPTPWVSRPNNIRNFYDTGLTMNNVLAFDGGNDDVRFRLSMGNFNQKGIVPNTDLNKYSIGGKFGIDIADRLDINLGVNYINSHSDNLVIQGYNNENPVQQMIWSGRQVDFEALRDYKNLPLNPDDTAAPGTPLNWNTAFQNNPYWVLNTNLNGFDKDRVLGNVNMKLDLTDHLFITGLVGADSWASVVTERKGKGSNENPEGYYQEIKRNFLEANMQSLIGYSNEIARDLDFEISAGVARMNRKYSRLTGEAPQLELDGLYTLSNIKSGVTPVINNRSSKSRINSVLGYGRLSYADAYYLDFTARNDWASVLPLENNSFFYPSVTLSAVLSEALNLTNNSPVSYLKLRAGWSKVGGIGALSPYSLENVFNYRTDQFGSVPRIFNPQTLNNPNIKPESTTGYELGFDSRFFNNKLRFDFTFYDQTSRDLIVPVEVSASTGYIFAWDNVGEMRNRGVELQLGTRLFENKNLFFDVDLNWAKNNNTVLSLGELDALTLGGQWSMSLEAREGMPYGVIFGPAYLRDETTNEIIHVDGLPQIADENKILGNIQPDWTGGANFTLGYKNVVASVLIDARKGSEIYSMTTTWGRYAGVLKETLIGRETGVVGEGVMPGPDGSYVENNVVVSAEAYNKAAFVNSVIEGSVFDASFVKLREASLTYKLPNKFLGVDLFQGASVSLIGRNLAILFRNAPHIDPESAFSSANGEQGQEFGQLPSVRSVGFNLNLKF